MRKKTFDTSDLVNGLTGGSDAVESQQPAAPVNIPSGGSRRGRKPMSAEEERISSIVKCDLYSKCKAIAATENIPIKDVINKALELVVAAYEEKHGPIKIKRNRKPGDINDIF